MEQFLKKYNLRPHKLFLIDALGALLTASMLGVVLIKHNSIVGMPAKVLQILAWVALIFSIYSIGCFYLIRKNKSNFLKVIASANLIYVLTTIVLLFIYRQSLTSLGFIYFILEVSIIIVLSKIELKSSWIYGK
ncbi:MAG: hypothetical protein HKN51_15440 [Saprospiraceae bacterium]|nr:hypothetical protein [Saprospiraceae bacterium]